MYLIHLSTDTWSVNSKYLVNKYLIPATCQVISFAEIKLPQPHLWQKAFFEKIRSRGTHSTFLQRTAGFMKLYTNFYLICVSHPSEVIGWPRLKHPTIRTIHLNSCLAQRIEHSRKPIPVSFLKWQSETWHVFLLHF